MSYLNSLLSILFPAHCLDCQRKINDQKEALCADCRKKIILPHTLFCGICGARLPLAKKVCHQNNPYVLGSISEYENPTIKKLIHALKFRGIQNTSAFLGQELASYAKNLNPQPEILGDKDTIIIPIPLSKTRLHARGFNQAAEIAKVFGKEMDLQIVKNILVRTTHTTPQSQTKSKKEREENVQGVFSVTHSEALNGKSVVLIDDVTTTGATLRSAAKVLREHGVKEILALTIAR